ncbi:MAG TPA: SDR family oxidoreductase, partial [Solirubrobacteraceae bacterium]|nr:SDR family oxidoreductase [Solirubrobacteraceae bacterium]
MPTAIVTGASRGLGLALAHALADRGWRLVVDARDGAALEAAVAPLRHRAHVVAIAGDIGDAWHRSGLVAAAGPRIELIVNNASSLGPSPLPTLGMLPLDALEQVLRTNVVAPLGLVQAALPQLVEGARVINVSSDAAVEPYEGWG